MSLVWSSRNEMQINPEIWSAINSERIKNLIICQSSIKITHQVNCCVTCFGKIRFIIINLAHNFAIPGFKGRWVYFILADYGSNDKIFRSYWMRSGAFPFLIGTPSWHNDLTNTIWTNGLYRGVKLYFQFYDLIRLMADYFVLSYWTEELVHTIAHILNYGHYDLMTNKNQQVHKKMFGFILPI